MPVQFKRFDVRKILAEGVEPFPEIRKRVDALKPGEGIAVVAPFLPSPLIEKLRARGIDPTEPEEKLAEGPLSGMRVCVTGTLSRPRSEIQRMIESAGGKFVTAVGKATNILVAGEGVGKAKLDAARKFGIRVMDEAALEALLAPPAGEEEETRQRVQE